MKERSLMSSNHNTENLEILLYPKGPKGTTFVPNITEDGTISWNNEGGLENPEEVNVRGTTFTPSVTPEGDISWTNDKGKENPETVNVRGATFTPSITEDGILSWENDKGLENPQTLDVMGATFLPSLDDEGNLSWTNNKGLPNPETVNIKGMPGFEFIIVEALPTVGSDEVMYFVPNGGNAGNAYDKYVWLSDINAYELVSTKEIESYSKTEVDELIDALCLSFIYMHQ